MTKLVVYIFILSIKCIIIFFFLFSDKMVYESASTPTTSRLLRSSTRTPPAHVGVKFDNPTSVSKISTNRKSNKNASCSSKKNKIKEEEKKVEDVNFYEDFEEKNDVVDEGNLANDECKEVAPLSVSIEFGYGFVVIQFKILVAVKTNLI